MDGAGQVGMKLEFSSDRFARMDWMTAKGREEPVALAAQSRLSNYFTYPAVSTRFNFEIYLSGKPPRRASTSDDYIIKFRRHRGLY